MNTLFEIFGYLTVVLHGLDFVAQSVLIGSVAFMLFVLEPSSSEDQQSAGLGQTDCSHIVRAAAASSIVIVAAATILNATVLASSLDASWREVAGAAFVIAGAVKIAAAACIGLAVAFRPPWRASLRFALGAAATLLLAASIATSHAVARIHGATVLILATAAHALGAAVWLGGLPCFWLALRRAPDPGPAARIARRYSVLAITGVALIAVGGGLFAAIYVGSVDAVYGTGYGAMAATKAVLFGILLSLGCANFLAAHRSSVAAGATARVRRFVEVEMGIGFATLMAASSITSLPPSVDLTADRVSWTEIVTRMAPSWPRLTSPDHASLALPALQARLDAEAKAARSASRPAAFVPGSGETPPRNAYDIAWSEYNHHWAGLVVVLMGFAALARKTGRASWAKHWPLLFLLLAAFLFLRADAEVWPMGEIGFLESLKDPEVAQHRVFELLIVVFALFEWGVSTGRIASKRLARVFPLLVALGGTLLLTHSHALANVKEEQLIELTHLPIAVLGIIAGWARWLEVEAPLAEGRWAGWIWPCCFVLIGLLLLDYREA